MLTKQHMLPQAVLFCAVLAFLIPQELEASAAALSPDNNMEATLQRLAGVMEKLEATMTDVKALLGENGDDYLSHAEMVDKGILPALGAELLLKFGFVWDILRTAVACSTSLLVIAYIVFEALVAGLFYWWTGGHIYTLSISLLLWNSASLLIFGLLAGVANRWRVGAEQTDPERRLPHESDRKGYGSTESSPLRGADDSVVLTPDELV